MNIFRQLLVFGGALGCNAVAGGDCDGWNSPFFFAHATESRIAECVERGRLEERDQRWGNAAVHAAASGGSVVGLRMLLQRGADPNAVGHRGATPLVYAIRVARSAEVVGALLEAGANPEWPDWRGVWPLHMAAAQDSHDIIGVLLESGANPVVVSRGDGLNALHHLLLRNPSPSGTSIGLLLSHGLDPNARTASGETALHFLSTHHDAAVAVELLRRGADPKIANAIGITPLHSASFGQSKAVVKALLRAGADVNAVDSRHRTALHYAASSPFACSAGIVEALLAAGAKDSVRDAGNRTPGELRAYWTEGQAGAPSVSSVAGHGLSVVETDCPPKP